MTAVLPCGRRRGRGARTVTTGWNVTGRMVQRNEFGQGRDDVGIFFTPREEHYFLRQKDALNQPAQKFPLYAPAPCRQRRLSYTRPCKKGTEICQGSVPWIQSPECYPLHPGTNCKREEFRAPSSDKGDAKKCVQNRW